MPPDSRPSLTVGLLSVIGGFVLLTAATGAGMVWLVQSASRTEVGDMVRIPAGGGAGAKGFGMELTARLASGQSCLIGIGVSADEGGSLVLERRTADDTFTAAWAATGRSVIDGPDCGHTADLTLSGKDIADLRYALAGGDPSVAQLQYMPP